MTVTSCDDINDSGKRNSKWVWWEDADKKRGEWIPMDTDLTPVQNGRYTRFYYNGNIYEKGTLKNGKNVDTTFFFVKTGEPYGFKLNISDTSSTYYYKDGKYNFYYDDGKLSCTGIVENHRIGNFWITYFYNGNVSTCLELKDGVGFEKNYYENGLQQDLIYFDKKNNSCFFVDEWYENGKVKMNGNIENGKMTGLVKRYYENGEIEFETFYKNGVREGLGKHYFENGRVEFEVFYRNDKREGLAEKYYENGQILLKQNYSNDVRDGKAQKWYTNGQLEADCNFKEGQHDGPQMIYYPNGELKMSCYYKDDIVNGTTRRFDSTGVLRSVERYVNGVRMN